MLASAMRQLTAQERTAFTLRYFEELSTDEIAETLGIAGNAARHSIFRAVQKLRRIMAPLAGAQAGATE
jgi:RNA polymerase sigma-70 factor (ECF subfamily)